jgi:hypothetical protein
MSPRAMSLEDVMAQCPHVGDVIAASKPSSMDWGSVSLVSRTFKTLVDQSATRRSVVRLMNLNLDQVDKLAAYHHRLGPAAKRFLVLRGVSEGCMLQGSALRSYLAARSRLDPAWKQSVQVLWLQLTYPRPTSLEYFMSTPDARDKIAGAIQAAISLIPALLELFPAVRVLYVCSHINTMELTLMQHVRQLAPSSMASLRCVIVDSYDNLYCGPSLEHKPPLKQYVEGLIDAELRAPAAPSDGRGAHTYVSCMKMCSLFLNSIQVLAPHARTLVCPGFINDWMLALRHVVTFDGVREIVIFSPERGALVPPGILIAWQRLFPGLESLDVGRHAGGKFTLSAYSDEPVPAEALTVLSRILRGMANITLILRDPAKATEFADWDPQFRCAVETVSYECNGLRPGRAAWEQLASVLPAVKSVHVWNSNSYLVIEDPAVAFRQYLLYAEIATDCFAALPRLSAAYLNAGIIAPLEGSPRMTVPGTITLEAQPGGTPGRYSLRVDHAGIYTPLGPSLMQKLAPALAALFPGVSSLAATHQRAAVDPNEELHSLMKVDAAWGGSVQAVECTWQLLGSVGEPTVSITLLRTIPGLRFRKMVVSLGGGARPLPPDCMALLAKRLSAVKEVEVVTVS